MATRAPMAHRMGPHTGRVGHVRRHLVGVAATPSSQDEPAAEERVALKAPTLAASVSGVTKRDWRSAEFTKIVTLGESTTAGGWSTSAERCWASLLGDHINALQNAAAVLVNSGIGANVISTDSPSYPVSGRPAADERVERHVSAHSPDLVIISYGLNDARGGTPLNVFLEKLRGVVEQIRAAQSAEPPLILLVGPYFMTSFDGYGDDWGHANLPTFHEFNAGVAELAVQEDCLYTDVLTASGETNWLVHFDGVHANDLGHRVIANAIFETLATSCSGLAQATQVAERVSPRWRDESVLKGEYGFSSEQNLAWAESREVESSELPSRVPSRVSALLDGLEALTEEERTIFVKEAAGLR